MNLEGNKHIISEKRRNLFVVATKVWGGADSDFDLYLSAHVYRNAHYDDWDGDARYEGDDHWRAEQHAHLPQNLTSL